MSQVSYSSSTLLTFSSNSYSTDNYLTHIPEIEADKGHFCVLFFGSCTDFVEFSCPADSARTYLSSIATAVTNLSAILAYSRHTSLNTIGQWTYPKFAPSARKSLTRRNCGNWEFRSWNIGTQRTQPEATPSSQLKRVCQECIAPAKRQTPDKQHSPEPTNTSAQTVDKH